MNKGLIYSSSNPLNHDIHLQTVPREQGVLLLRIRHTKRGERPPQQVSRRRSRRREGRLLQQGRGGPRLRPRLRDLSQGAAGERFTQPKLRNL